MRATISHHLQETAAGMEILLIFLQVRRKFVDFSGKDSDLHVGRAGILVVDGRVSNNGRFNAFRKHWHYDTTS